MPILLERLHNSLGELGHPYEIVAVDDGSRNDSFARLRDHGEHDGQLASCASAATSGQTAAFSAGFDRAHGEVVITLDADLQNDPSDIGELLAKIHGATMSSAAGGFSARTVPPAAPSLDTCEPPDLVATGVRLHDFGCSLKAYRSEVLGDLRCTASCTGLSRRSPAGRVWRWPSCPYGTLASLAVPSPASAAPFAYCSIC